MIVISNYLQKIERMKRRLEKKIQSETPTRKTRKPVD